MTQVSDNAPVYLWTPERPLRNTDVHRAVRVTGTLKVSIASVDKAMRAGMSPIHNLDASFCERRCRV